MEQLYHYLWQTKLKGTHYRDVSGLDIDVIDPGIHNHNSGPDFFNSKIRIDGIEWIGNVEIHEKASDWFRHGHDKDAAYDNVILHVVGVSDKRIHRVDGRLVPQIEFTLPENFFRTYATLSQGTEGIKCASTLQRVPDLNKNDWLESLFVERMQQKAQKVLEIHHQTGFDWEQTCFVLFARGLGFGLNGDPFEILAKSIPLRILHHHSDNLLQIEAILFGQAAMLDPTLYMFDEYFQQLCREYYFLSKKYGLKPMKQGLWKYSKTRPHNFPHRRLAFLASSAFGGFSLFSRLLEQVNPVTPNRCSQFEEVFDYKVEGFWYDHFSFDTKSGILPTEFSKSSKVLLAINVAIPLLYAYASKIGDTELGEKVIGLMTEFPAENNVITRQWDVLGFPSKDASRSQALLHLKKEYCDGNKCIYCRFGHLFLRQSITSP